MARVRPLARAQSTVSLGRLSLTGSTQIAVAPRPWETVGAPTQVLVSAIALARDVTLPAAGTQVGPAMKLYLTFSRPVNDALGSSRPHLSPAIAGHWRRVNSHTLVFAPAGMGAAFGSRLRLQLPGRLGRWWWGPALHKTREVQWTVPPGSTLRLQQLLAQAGYLPLRWHRKGAGVARTSSAEAQAAVSAPKGTFSWRYANTPHQLRALWSAGHENTVTRGALMKFENENDLTVDGLPDSALWHELIANATAGKRLRSGYSYVYVHREVPQTVTLWHDGHTILT